MGRLRVSKYSSISGSRQQISFQNCRCLRNFGTPGQPCREDSGESLAAGLGASVMVFVRKHQDWYWLSVLGPNLHHQWHLFWGEWVQAGRWLPEMSTRHKERWMVQKQRWVAVDSFPYVIHLNIAWYSPGYPQRSREMWLCYIILLSYAVAVWLICIRQLTDLPIVWQSTASCRMDLWLKTAMTVQLIELTTEDPGATHHW